MLALRLLDGEPGADEVWRPQPHHESVSFLSGTRVLLAEDDAVVRGMVQRILFEQGCEVHAARHDEEALGLALQAVPPTIS